jgi:hypothetical protein
MLVLILIASFKAMAWQTTYEAICGYKDMPANMGAGWQKLKVLYGNDLWGERPAGVGSKDWPPRVLGLKEEKRIRALAKHCREEGDSMICIDIEHFNLSGTDIEAKDAINFYEQVLGWIREANSDAKIGFFGTLPICDYWRAIRERNSREYASWFMENKRLDALADAVDIFFPCLYTFYNRPVEWEQYAKANIHLAKRWGKPILPFVWPRYHQSNLLLGLKFLSQDYWAEELRFVKSEADGVVVWDYGSGKSWDPNAVWWQTMIVFNK